MTQYQVVDLLVGFFLGSLFLQSIWYLLFFSFETFAFIRQNALKEKLSQQTQTVNLNECNKFIRKVCVFFFSSFVLTSYFIRCAPFVLISFVILKSYRIWREFRNGVKKRKKKKMKEISTDSLDSNTNHVLQP